MSVNPLALDMRDNRQLDDLSLGKRVDARTVRAADSPPDMPVVAVERCIRVRSEVD